MGNHIHKAWRRKEKGISEAPDLPVEILIAIFARLDPVTLVRCAATSKLLRRHITDPAFLRLIRGRHASGGGGFVPSLLVGIFFFQHVHEGKTSRFAPLPPHSSLKLSLAPPADDDTCRIEPVESRAGLVVLRRSMIGPGGTTVVELCVGSPVTGRYVLLPPTTLRIYSHVLLPAADDDDDSVDGFSFRLFLLGRAARTQTFSSRTGAWGPVTEPPPANLQLYPRASSCLAQEPAVVIRGVAHWLHLYDDSSQRYGVLSIRVGTGQATAAEVPQRCLRWRRRAVAEELLLVRTADGRLGLLVAETLGIAMWTLSSEDSTSTTASWARRVVVSRTRILESVTKLQHCHPLVCVDTKLEWFGEASGTMLFQMNFTGMLLLNLQTCEISQFGESTETRQSLQCKCQPYEMDPVPILAAMKSYSHSISAEIQQSIDAMEEERCSKRVKME